MTNPDYSPDPPSPCPRRIGLFGGTFDPIHIGHLASAAFAQEREHLEEIWFIPSALPPHKRRAAEHMKMPSPEQRYLMVQLATLDHPRFRVIDDELRRPGPSYSVDTVSALQARQDEPTQMQLILGMDAFAEIETWHRHQELLALVTFIVLSRPGSNAPACLSHLSSETRSALGIAVDGALDSRSQAVPALSASPSQGARVRFLEAPALDVSSSGIRAAIREGRSVRYLVPEPVRHLIEKEKLYK
ncbi:MAG: nicotinate (nicotinamide) nucleotide adenylyltransferase [Candidatus Schekmanbacteria bacterium]|nr:nicotinate (nicotinamide) nucleotide adenylyltransferase [Candidatus Schekmanbacteria bacterium]